MWIDAFREEHRLSWIRTLLVMHFRVDAERLKDLVREVVVLDVVADILKSYGLNMDTGQHGSVMAD